MRTKKELNIQIGEQIRFAREQANFTQEQLAEQIEVSPQYISDLERGVVGISIATLKRACVTLCVSSDQILFGRSSNDAVSMIADQCKTLSNEQTAIVSQIIRKFVEGIQLERRQHDSANPGHCQEDGV